MDKETFDISGKHCSPKNPFCNESEPEHITFGNISFNDFAIPSLPALNDEDFLARESLGILPTSTLVRDSLTVDFLSTHSKSPTMPSPRESLGILDISAMDLGRESMGIFNINSPIFKRFVAGTGKEPDSLQKTLISPQILLNNIEDKVSISSLTEFDKGFLLPHSRKISCLSSRSSGLSTIPSFNSRSICDTSNISSISAIPKDANSNNVISKMDVTDLFNEAFQLPIMHSVSYKSSSTHYSFADELKNIKNRILSLPLPREEHVLAGSIFNKIENVSFDGGLVCRGVETDFDLEDSVFFQDKKLKDEDTPFDSEEKSFNEERYLLDSTPQPDWDEFDSSKSEDVIAKISPNYNKESVSKKVDEMLGMQPVNLDEKLKLKSTSKSSVDVSQNISKISRASQCSMTEHPSSTNNNFSQDLSKISQSGDANVSGIIKKLSDVINKKENLSKSQKTEGLHLLACLAGFLCDGNESFGSGNSAHSPEGPHSPSNGKVLEALDLSCKNKSNVNLSGLKSNNPPPYVNSPNRVNASFNGLQTSGTNAKSSNSLQDISRHNYSKASLKNGSVESLRRHSGIAQNKFGVVTEKLRKTHVSLKKEPLRAVLPVENMAKGARKESAGTPERTEQANKFGMNSKKASTPLQQPKLRPMASSTPTGRPSTNSKENGVPNINGGKPKITRSFSYQPRTSLSDQPINSRKSGEVAALKNIVKKGPPKFVRRNSESENALNRETNRAGSPRLKRSFSTGKESKILSALSKVRQNILNSPYYNPRKTLGVGPDGVVNGSDSNLRPSELKPLDKISSKRPLGKENVKP